ncbi:MAG: Ig-like domain-containing protein [Scytonema sp. PMC 1069.18]|nr:Ig-like domain-containing protein [Scytonema sp. PMC 1069.18]MEC4886278.1 Ig-like domain-containing protein [Scytonema sp. PMC 1070.18]
MSINKTFFQPLDRVAIALMLILSILIAILVLQGDAVKPMVRQFSWQNQKISTDDISFALTFSRPMNQKSVEENLTIEPPLAGKVSWAGRRMVYTLLTPAPYGTNYTVKLQDATDKFAEKEGKKREMQPFTGTFRTRDRVLLYIGADKKDTGKLILYNLTKEQKKVLTPKDLVVMDYEPFPSGDKIMFSARASTSQDLLSSQVYTVTTGIAVKAGEPAEPPGRIDLLLDNKEYQNLKFDLSPDGETLVIQRGKRNDPSDFGLWFMSVNTKESGEKPLPKRLKTQPVGDFIITPDSKAVAVAQGQGAAILPLQTDASKPLDFLPQFGLVQAFSKDGSQAAMVKFNTDYTRDLFLVTNQGTQRQLLRTTGTILQCQFDNASPTLYCLLTQLLEAEYYQEQPYLLAINLKDGQQKPLLLLPPDQRNMEMSLAPDGLGLLFDQVVPQTTVTKGTPTNILTTEDGQTISTSNLWLMPLVPFSDPTAEEQIQPEQLPLVGFHPSWLP